MSPYRIPCLSPRVATPLKCAPEDGSERDLRSSQAEPVTRRYNVGRLRSPQLAP